LLSQRGERLPVTLPQPWQKARRQGQRPAVFADLTWMPSFARRRFCRLILFRKIAAKGFLFERLG
jgi:hypothetical protein